MFCRKCGAQMQDGQLFCTTCGAKIEPLSSVNPVETTNPVTSQGPFGVQPNVPANNNGKKKRTGLKVALILVALLVVVGIAVSAFVMITRDKDGGDTKEKKDARTIMVYMIGSDLESNDGSATNDISEMCNAGTSKNVNIVLQTGGTTEWQNNRLKDGVVQRSVVKDGDLEIIEDLGKLDMAKESTLSDFIKWAKKEYPAETYSLILWDHGGGPVYGYGKDEVFPTGKLMLPNDIEKAIDNADIHFDFIGFDACLMANFEIAYMLREHADYLIASEESEYGNGWFYTGFIDKIVNHPDCDTKDICKKIVMEMQDENEEYIKTRDDSWAYTISAIDLSKMDSLMESYKKFSKEVVECIKDGNNAYNIARVRFNAKKIGAQVYELVDFKDYVNKCNINASKSLANAIDSAVVYNKTNCSDENGLSLYLPYENLDRYLTVQEYYKDYMPEEVLENNKYFAAVMGYGTGNTKYTWFNSEYKKIAENSMSKEPVLAETGKSPFVRNSKGIYSWVLSSDKMNKIKEIRDDVYIKSGSNIYWYGTVNNKEKVTGTSIDVLYDYKWYAINGQMVPMIYQGENQLVNGERYTYSYVPAVLTRNNKSVNVFMVVYIRKGETNGVVKGVISRTGNVNTEYFNNVAALKQGDVLQVCNVYVDNNANITSVKKDGVTIKYSGSDIPVQYSTFANKNQDFYFRRSVYDYFGRSYVSPMVH